MDWLTTITHTFFDIPSMLQVFPQLLGVGLVNTLVISIAATVIGVVLGMAVAVMGISTSRWLRIPRWGIARRRHSGMPTAELDAPSR